MTGNAAKQDLRARCAAEPETDIGNSRRFRHRYGEDVLSIAKIGWHGFDDTRWREDEDGSIVRPLAHKTAEQIHFETLEIVAEAGEAVLIEAGDDAAAEMERIGPPPKDADRERKRAWELLQAAVAARDQVVKQLDDRSTTRVRHARSSCNSAKLDNMLKEAAPYLSRTVDAMNIDPLALNCRNGTLRFVPVSSGEGQPARYVARLDPHQRADFITKRAEASVLRPPESSDDGSAP